MATTKIRGTTQIIDASIKDAQIASDAAIALSKLAEAVLQADGGQTLTGDWDIGGTHKITNMPSPTASSDAATKSYVDSKVSGLSWQDPVIKMIHYVKNTTGAPSGTATDDEYCLNTYDQKIYHYSSGWDSGSDTSTGDRYLFGIDGSDTSGNSGTYTADNKIYEDNGSSIDSEDPEANWTLLIEDASYQVPSDTQWTYNDDNLEWVQISGAGQIVAGAGLSKTGNTINVGAQDNGGINVNTDDIGINTDDSTLEVTSGSPGTLQVKDGGITETQLASSVAGDGLIGGAGSPLAVNPGNGITIASDKVEAKLKQYGGLGADTLGLYVSTDDESVTINGSNKLEVRTDGSTIHIDTNNHYIEVMDSGILEQHLDIYNSPNDGDALTWKDDTSQFKWTSFTGTDEKVGVSSNDTTPGYLNDEVAEGDGIVTTVLNSGADESLQIEVNADTSAGLQFDGSNPSKLQVNLDNTGGLGFSSGAIGIVQDGTTGGNTANVIALSTNGAGIGIDNSTIKENGSNQLYVPNGGITETQLNTSVAGDGLSGGGGTALHITESAASAISVGTDSISVVADNSTLQVGSGTPGQLMLKYDGVTENHLNTSVAGGGIAGGGGTTLSVDLVSMEVPSGSINGSNTTFTLANTPVSLNSRVALFLILNGLVLEEGGSADYTISGSTITMNYAPKSGSKLIAFYFK